MMASYDEQTRSFCSAALAEVQLDFVRERPAKLKSLIRLVKHWCKSYLPNSSDRQRMPNSYLIELVTIHSWEQAGKPDRFETAALFKAIMVAFCSHSQLNIAWNRYHNLGQVTRYEMLF
jgi:2'-5'-oligoadenylate synthetase